MWNLLSSIGFILSPTAIAALEAFLTVDFADRGLSTAIQQVFEHVFLVWAAIVGCAMLAFCVRYVKRHGLPSSKVTIRRDDDLFPVVLDFLQQLRQPSSALILAITKGSSGMHWDSDADSDADPDKGKINDSSEIVKFEPDYGKSLYWNNLQPMWVERKFLPDSGGRNSDSTEVLSLTIWSWSPTTMRDIAAGWLRKSQVNEIDHVVIREVNINGWYIWSHRVSKPVRPLESIILAQETKDSIVQDLEDFLSPKTRQWYMQRGYPYRRGHLYHGDPGTGKSSLAIALAGRFHLELYVVPINDPGVSQEKLAQMFRELREPCMILLEDIDALNATTTERGSSKASESGQKNLSALLNHLDGVTAKESIILIMTSNHLEALDKALVRPGRVDKKVYFDKAGLTELKDLFLITYLSDPSIHTLAQQFSQRIPSKQFTIAEVQEFLFHHRYDPHSALANASTWSRERIKELSSSPVGVSLKDQNSGHVKELVGNGDNQRSVSSSADSLVADASEENEEINAGS